MALVNPQIAMSYRPTVEYQPRNALAEYAQIQSIVGGQRQAEMADMQMEALRRERDALGQIQAAIVAKGGPPDLEAAADAMIKTGRPEYLTQGMAIRTALRNQREAEAYRRDFGGGAAPANALVAPAAAAPASQGELVAAPIRPSTVTARDIPPVGGAGALQAQPLYSMNDQSLANLPGDVQNSIRIKLEDAARLRADTTDPQSARAASRRSQAEMLENQAARLLMANKPGMEITGGPDKDAIAQQKFNAPFYLALPENQRAAVDREFNLARDKALLAQATQSLGFQVTPANALAPAAAPVANALAPAAVPVAAAAAAPDANAIRLRALEAQYRRIGNNPELASEKALVLKQIEDVQATIRAENATPPEAKFMRVLGLPLTREGYAEFEALKQRPGEFERLLSQSGLSKADQTALIQQRARTMAAPTPAASVTVKLPPLEGAEQKGKGELNVKQYGEIASAARLAAKTLPAIETQAKIINSADFTTGFGTDVKKAGASVLAALGVPEAERFATNAQTFIAATQQAVLQKQLEQKGVQTQADADRITQTGAQLGNTTAANRFIIDVAKAQLQRDIDQRNFYDKWWSNNKTYEGAESAWYTGDGGKSLFDRPELKKYAAPAGAGAPAAAPGSVRSQADAILQRK